jgi:hypothetical protein
VLVERYGSMILGVCRRMLSNTHDSEDRFRLSSWCWSTKAAACLGAKSSATGRWPTTPL